VTARWLYLGVGSSSNITEGAYGRSSDFGFVFRVAEGSQPLLAGTIIKFAFRCTRSCEARSATVISPGIPRRKLGNAKSGYDFSAGNWRLTSSESGNLTYRVPFALGAFARPGAEQTCAPL
jgi:hypothetical protein